MEFSFREELDRAHSHLRLQFIRKSVKPAEIETLNQANLDCKWQELKQRKDKVRFYWKVTVRRLHKIALAHPLNLIRHHSHVGEITDMLNDRVRKYKIKLSISELMHISGIADNGDYV